MQACTRSPLFSSTGMVSMIYVRLHDSENGVLLAMCDEKLIDKVIEEGEVYINIRDYSDFYKGELVSKDEVGRLLPEKLHSANIVGNEAVEAAVEHSIIKREHVRTALGVRYANAYSVDV